MASEDPGMSAKPNVVKIQKEDWQKAVLVKFHEKGMTGTGKQCEGLLLEASQESGLPLQTVKDWVLNQGRPNRYKKAPKMPKSAYQAFMKDFKPQSSDANLGEIAKERAAQYRSLQETEEGRALLERRFIEQKLQDVPKPELSEAQKTNAIRREMDLLQQSCTKLMNFGVYTSFMYALPNGTAGMGGCQTGVHFWENRRHLMLEYARVVLEARGAVPKAREEDCRVVLRKKVQDLFSLKYQEASGLRQACPYRRMAAGTSDFVMVDLPVTMKKPSDYSIKDLKAILASSVKCQRKDMTPSQAEEHASTSTNLAAEQVTNEPSPSTGMAAEQVTNQPSPSTGMYSEENREEVILSDDLVLIMKGSSMELQTNNSEEEMADNLVELQGVIGVEDSIKSIQEDMERKKRGKGKSKTQKVERLYNMADGSKKWYKGDAVHLKGGILKVTWEDEAIVKMKKKTWEREMKLGNFKFL